MRSCPECKTPFETVDLQDGQIDVCLFCKGIFFEFDEMKIVLKHVLQDRFLEVQMGDNISDHSIDYLCPKCGQNMSEEEYGFNSGIHIDRCNGCSSIFLNGGESNEINKYLSSMESKDVQDEKIKKIELEYEDKWKKIVQHMYDVIKKRWVALRLFI